MLLHSIPKFLINLRNVLNRFIYYIKLGTKYSLLNRFKNSKWKKKVGYDFGKK